MNIFMGPFFQLGSAWSCLAPHLRAAPLAFLGGLFLLVSHSSFAQADCQVTIGQILPISGQLAVAGKMSPWIDNYKTKLINDNGGLQIGPKKCKIVFKIYDSQSSVTGAINAANRAVLNDKVDILLLGYAEGAADVCERTGTPCISSALPIEPWLYGPDGKPRHFVDTYHFFFKVSDLVKNHLAIIKSQPGTFDGVVGFLYPNDADGVAFASLFGPAVKKAGWTAIDPGRFSEGLPDFSSIINQFKRNHVDVVLGVLSPPDLQNYLEQAVQSGFRPKTYIIDKATGYAESMAAIGQAGDGIIGVNAWSPAFPGKSSYGGWTGSQLVQVFEHANPATQYSLMLGYEDAMYDVAFAALQTAKSTDKAAIVRALASVDVDTVVGRVHFNDLHYSVQPLGGAQWRYDKASKRWIKENVFNEIFPSVALTAKMRLYGQ